MAGLSAITYDQARGVYYLQPDRAGPVATHYLTARIDAGSEALGQAAVWT